MNDTGIVAPGGLRMRGLLAPTLRDSILYTASYDSGHSGCRGSRS